MLAEKNVIAHEALAEFNEAVQLDPNNGEAHREFGEALFVSFEGKQAAQAFVDTAAKALERKTKSKMKEVKVQGIEGASDDLEGALRELSQAVRLDPTDAEAQAYLGAALCENKELDAGIADLRESLRLKPDFAMAHFKLGAALEEVGDRQGALEHLCQAHSLEPTNTQYRDDYKRLRKALRQ